MDEHCVVSLTGFIDYFNTRLIFKIMEVTWEAETKLMKIINLSPFSFFPVITHSLETEATGEEVAMCPIGD